MSMRWPSSLLKHYGHRRGFPLWRWPGAWARILLSVCTRARGRMCWPAPAGRFSRFWKDISETRLHRRGFRPLRTAAAPALITRRLLEQRYRERINSHFRHRFDNGIGGGTNFGDRESVPVGDIHRGTVGGDNH